MLSALLSFKGDICWVDPVLGMTVSISSATRSSSGGSFTADVDDDVANITSDTISENNLQQEFLAESLTLHKKSETKPLQEYIRISENIISVCCKRLYMLTTMNYWEHNLHIVCTQ